MSNITRTRGDTRRIRRTVKLAGVAQDITGWSFLLTINSEWEPTDTDEQVAQIVGTLTDPTNGIVDFFPQADDVETAGQFYYDIESRDDGGYISTLDKGEFVLLQDITKENESFEWTPSETPSDGAAYVPYSSADGPYCYGDRDLTGLITYETRDGRRVLRNQTYLSSGNYDGIGIMFTGPQIPRSVFPVPGWEWRVTVYMNLAKVSLSLIDGAYYQSFWSELDSRTGTFETNSTGGTLYSEVSLTYEYLTMTEWNDPTGWTAGWYEIGLRINADNTVSFQAKPEGGDDDWVVAPSGYIWNPGCSPILSPNSWLYRNRPTDPGSVIDLWKYEWRRLP